MASAHQTALGRLPSTRWQQCVLSCVQHPTVCGAVPRAPTWFDMQSQGVFVYFVSAGCSLMRGCGWGWMKDEVWCLLCVCMHHHPHTKRLAGAPGAVLLQPHTGPLVVLR